MLVYDITNEKSFDNIRNWIRNIEEVRRSDITAAPWALNSEGSVTLRFLFRLAFHLGVLIHDH